MYSNTGTQRILVSYNKCILYLTAFPPVKIRIHHDMERHRLSVSGKQQEQCTVSVSQESLRERGVHQFPPKRSDVGELRPTVQCDVAVRAM